MPAHGDAKFCTFICEPTYDNSAQDRVGSQQYMSSTYAFSQNIYNGSIRCANEMHSFVGFRKRLLIDKIHKGLLNTLVEALYKRRMPYFGRMCLITHELPKNRALVEAVVVWFCSHSSASIIFRLPTTEV